MYPTDAQADVMRMHCDHARFVWNLALEQCGHARRFGTYADQKAWDRQLAEARRWSDWLAGGSSSVQQAALRDLRQAFRNWWGNPAHFRAPSWRSVRKGFQGFVVRDLTWRRINRHWGEVQVPKAGRVRFRWSRRPQDAKSARVTLDRSGRWHVSFVAPQPEIVREPTGAVVALDLGVAATVTTSDGDHLHAPTPDWRALARLQRRMARQQKGSNRRERTRQRIARARARDTDRRRDWTEKATTALVAAHDMIVVEDLKVAQMSRSARGTADAPGRNVRAKAGLNRSIRAQAWGEFRARLETKAATCGVQVVAVNPAHTSQRCHECGHTSPGNRESQAVFQCQGCGHTANADVNAAANILAAGLAVSGRGGPPVGVPVEASTSRNEAQ
jgi:IS605 OrfB family transposase